MTRVGLRDSAALAVSAATGSAVMGAEIAAGRLVAPYFGTSTTTWAFLVGLVLASLAAGNLAGARLSRRPGGAAALPWLLLAGAVVLAALPTAGPAVMLGTLERFARGDAGGLALRAVPVALLLGIPVLAAGAAGPLVLQLAGARRGDALPHELGGLAGRISAAGTLGSLAGTFLAGVVLVQWLGTAAALDACAFLLAAAAVAGASLARSGRRALVAAAAVGAAVVVSAILAPAVVRLDRRRLQAFESRYNHIEVWASGAQLQLRVGEGYAVQSYVRRDGALPVDSVWGTYAVAPALAARPGPARVLVLGLGGGTSASVARRLHPRAVITGVELDPEMPRAGRERLGINLDGIDVRIGDARTELRRAAADGATWDVILLDAFQFPYVPFHLATREFFSEVADRLAPGGVLMMNVGRAGPRREVVDAVARTLASVFPHVHAADARGGANTLLVATRHPLAEAVGAERVDVAPEHRDTFRRLAAALPSFEAARWPPGTPILTDDHAPVEWLTDRIVWETLLGAGKERG